MKIVVDYCIWRCDQHEQFTGDMLCASWYRLGNFKNVKNTHGEVLLLVKSKANVTLLHELKWHSSLSVFTFFELYRWYQIAQRITDNDAIWIELIGVSWKRTRRRNVSFPVPLLSISEASLVSVSYVCPSFVLQVCI